MEWLWQLMDRIHKGVAFSALQSFSLIDWIFVLVVLWGFIQGSRKGFSDMFGKLLGIFLVSMLTLSFYKKGADFLVSNLPVLSSGFAEAASFFLLTVFLWLSVSWCINVFGKFLKVEAQGILRTLGGVIFGILRMLLLLSFLVQMLLLLPIEPLRETFKPGRTYSGYTVSRFVPDLHRLVSGLFLRKPSLNKPVESHKVGG